MENTVYLSGLQVEREHVCNDIETLQSMWVEGAIRQSVRWHTVTWGHVLSRRDGISDVIGKINDPDTRKETVQTSKRWERQSLRIWPTSTQGYDNVPVKTLIFGAKVQPTSHPTAKTWDQKRTGKRPKRRISITAKRPPQPRIRSCETIIGLGSFHSYLEGIYSS